MKFISFLILLGTLGLAGCASNASQGEKSSVGNFMRTVGKSVMAGLAQNPNLWVEAEERKRKAEERKLKSDMRKAFAERVDLWIKYGANESDVYQDLHECQVISLQAMPRAERWEIDQLTFNCMRGKGYQ